VDSFQPPTLTAGGGTPMGEAVRRALTLLRERKEIYKQNGYHLNKSGQSPG